MARRRWTRKQLKQPDEFLTLSLRAMTFAREHVRLIAGAVGIAAVAGAGVAAAWAWQGRRSTVATAALSDALDAFLTPVVPPGAGAESEAEAEKAADPGERYASLEERAQAVLEAVEDADRGAVADEAAALRGAALHDRGQDREAEQAYLAFLRSAAGDHPLRPLAYEALGYLYEERDDLDKALGEFRRMAPGDASPLRDLGDWHEARVLEKQGHKDEARKRLQGILDRGAPSWLRDQVVARLSALP